MARYPRADGMLESAIAIHRTAAPAHVAHRQASTSQSVASNDSGYWPAYLRGLQVEGRV